MGDPHREDRYGETWPQHRIDAYLKVLRELRPHVAFSGGWAWHFMSPPGHVEYKHAHDHKDVDVLVPPRSVASAMEVILGLGFARVTTKYDRFASPEEFRRYEKVVAERDGDPFRITIDFFVREVPTVTCPDGWVVVDPRTLVSFYGGIHSSSECFAVRAARRLIAQGVDPVGRPELAEIPPAGR